RTFAHRASEEVVKQFAGSVIGQELIVLQVYRRGLDPLAVLHRSVDPIRERGFVQMAAGARLDFGLVLGDDQPQGWKVLDLPLSNAIDGLIDQRTTLMFAYLNTMHFRMVRHVDYRKNMDGMARLAAGLALTHLAQDFARGFIYAFSGGRFAAVARFCSKF